MLTHASSYNSFKFFFKVLGIPFLESNFLAKEIILGHSGLQQRFACLDGLPEGRIDRPAAGQHKGCAAVELRWADQAI